MDPVSNAGNDSMVKTEEKLVSREAQLNLLELVHGNEDLLQSKILSSLNPRTGRNFSLHKGLDVKVKALDLHYRKERILIAIEEARLDINKLKTELKDSSTKPSDTTDLVIRINKRLNKKVNFHLEKSEKENMKIAFVPLPTSKKTRQNKNKTMTKERKREKHRRWRKNKQGSKKKELTDKVEEIKKNNIVINLSDAEIPDLAYLYLANGLNFVPSQIVETTDLKFDSCEFLRKLKWRTYFEQNPDHRTSDQFNEVDIHPELRVKSKSHPEIKHALLDDIKTKLLGWV